MCNRACSALTQTVNCLTIEIFNEFIYLSKLMSGQLPFLGLIRLTWPCLADISCTLPSTDSLKDRLRSQHRPDTG